MCYGKKPQLRRAEISVFTSLGFDCIFRSGCLSHPICKDNTVSIKYQRTSVGSGCASEKKARDSEKERERELYIILADCSHSDEIIRSKTKTVIGLKKEKALNSVKQV